MRPLMVAGGSGSLSYFHLNGPSCGVTHWGKFAPTHVHGGGGKFPFRHEIPAMGWKRVPGLPASPAAAVEGMDPRRLWRVRRSFGRRVGVEQDGFAGPASSAWAASSATEVTA